MSGLGKKILQGKVWVTIDRFGTMALSFIVNLILARLLLPADFGCIGMLAIFISVSQVMVDGGFGSALIQKKIRQRKTIQPFFIGIFCFHFCCMVLYF